MAEEFTQGWLDVNTTAVEAGLARLLMKEHQGETAKIEGELVQCSVTGFLVMLAGFLASDEKIDLFVCVDSECGATKDGLRLFSELERCLTAILDGAKLPFTQLSVGTIGHSPAKMSICDAGEYVKCLSVEDQNEAPREGEGALLPSTEISQCEDLAETITLLAKRIHLTAEKKGSECHVLSFLPQHVTRALQVHVSGLARGSGGERLAFEHLELTSKSWNAEAEVEHINTIRAGQGGNWIVSIDPEQFPVCLPVSPSFDVILCWKGSSNVQQRLRVHPMDGRLQASPHTVSTQAFLLAWRYKLEGRPNAVDNDAFVACLDVQGPQALFQRDDAVSSLHKHIHWAAYFMNLPGLAAGAFISKTWRAQNNATGRNLATALGWAANMGAACKSETGTRVSSKAPLDS